jgi:hypothetical protein
MLKKSKKFANLAEHRPLRYLMRRLVGANNIANITCVHPVP